MNLVIYCADIGSVPNNRFGWGRAEMGVPQVDAAPGGSEIGDFVDAIAADINRGHPVALGFECPLFVPVPVKQGELGKARIGEGNRSWSAGAGSGALATGLVQVAWIMAELRERIDEAPVSLRDHTLGSGLAVAFAAFQDRARIAGLRFLLLGGLSSLPVGLMLLVALRSCFSRSTFSLVSSARSRNPNPS